MVEMIATSLTVLAAVGWVFKVWIITPLSQAIGKLNENLSEMKNVISTIQAQNLEYAKNIASISESVKSSHNRLDDFGERLHSLERELRARHDI